MAKKMDEPKSKSGKNMAMKKSMKPRMAMNKSVKPIEQKSLQRTTRKLSDTQTIDSRKGTSKSEMSKNIMYGGAERDMMKAKKANFKNENLNDNARNSIRKVYVAEDKNPLTAIDKAYPKMKSDAYNAGILRTNIAGKPNPTPYPRVEASKKPKMASRIVSRLKKK